MFREDGCRNDLHTGWSLSRDRGARGGEEGAESRRGRSLQFCANSSSGPQGELRRRAFLGPRNRGGKKVITFFAGRSRLKTAGGVVIASDDGAAPGGCYRTSLSRGKTLLSSFISPLRRAPPGKRNIIPRGRLPELIPRARPRKLQASRERVSFCRGSRWIRVENVPRNLHPRPPTSLQRTFLTNQCGFFSEF